MAAMTEIILNAVINLFAVLASSLPEDRRGHVRESLEMYLRAHLKIWNIDDYASLYQEALSLQESTGQPRKIELIQRISSTISSKIPLLDQYTFAVYYLYPASLASDNQETQAIVRAVMDNLNVDKQQAESIKLLYSFPDSSTADSTGLIIKNDGQASSPVESAAKKIVRPDFLGSFTALYLKDADALF
ncbi:MAG: hypothetical protein R6X11_04030, partial [Desulfonatronovibrio sp.]